MKSFIADKKQKLSRQALEKVENLSYTSLQKSLRAKDVKVNGVRVKEDVVLNVGDKVEIYFKEIVVEKFTTLFRDENVLVIYKKSGYTSESVFEELCKKEPVYFIHRLDRNTDGVMIFALNKVSELELLQGFKQRNFVKKYKATVFGKMPKNEDVLTAYLKKDSENSKVQIFDFEVKGSVQIRTGYKVLKQDGEVSQLLVTLYTGKTHQIRAHLAHIGHFIVGDGKYGENTFNKKMGAKEQMLTAFSLTLQFAKNSPLFYLNGKEFSLEFVKE